MLDVVLVRLVCACRGRFVGLLSGATWEQPDQRRGAFGTWPCSWKERLW